jgi:anti-anti-sigma factor
MEISSERSGAILVVAPKGRVDSTTSDELKREVSDAVAAGERRIVLDFTGVDYISSAGLRILLIAEKELRGVGGALVLCGPTEPVRQVLTLSGFMTLLTVESTRDAALARAGGTAATT